MQKKAIDIQEYRNKEGAQAKLRILILEDNSNDAELIQYELERAGLTFISRRVETEESYAKALKEFSPDLILSDYDLPLFSGILALSEAKKQSPDVPFILVTGAVTEERAIEVLTSGARDYVLKHRLERLAPAVLRALAEAAEHKARKAAEEELREAHRSLEKKVAERTAALEAEMAERRRRENSLRESEERFSRAFYASPAALLIGRVSDGVFVDANESFLKLFEYQRDEVIGHTATNLNMFVDPDERAKIIAVYREHGSVHNYELSVRTKTGKILRIVFATEIITIGNVGHSLSTLIDITDRKRAEEALKEGEQRWLTTLASIGDAVIATDHAGRITFMNPIAEKKTGWPIGEVMSEPVTTAFNIINEHTRQKAENPVERVLREGAIVGLANHTILIRKDGVEVPIDDSGAPIKDKDGRITGVVLVFRDITESKQAQAEIEYQASFPRLNPNPITEVDLEGGIRFMNPAAEELFPDLRRLGLAHPWLADWDDAVANSLEKGQHDREIKIGEDWYSQSMYRVGGTGRIRLYGRRITARKLAQEALKESQERVRTKLEKIMSPTGDIGNLELADSIDIPAIQSFMDDFYRLAHIPMTIGDLRGKVLVGVGWQDICTKFHRAHPDTCRHCIESDRLLSAEIPQGEFRLYKCKNNMWDLATPLMIGGRHVGNIYSGQFFFEDEPLDYDLFRSQARQYGFDEEAYLSALKAVPRLSRETLDTAMTFFIKLAEMISKLSYSNIMLARTLAQQDALTASVKESRERLRSIFDNSIDAIIITKPEGEGVILSVNRAASRMFGWTKDEMRGMSQKDILDLNAPGLQEFLTKRSNAGESQSVLRYRRKDGSTFLGELTTGLFRNRSGGVEAVAIVRDITERKQAEEELKRRSIELESANKELESFSYSVSHDLRAPLRAIEGFSRMLLREGDQGLDERADRTIRTIQDNALKMDKLICDLLNFSRSGRAALSRNMIDINELAKEIWNEELAANPNRKMELVQRDLPAAYGDRNLIRQVLANLLANAVKFTRKRKTTVIEIGGEIKGTETVYFVKDNGAGFDMKYYDKLFGVFQRLHSESKYEGTGVGLAIVQRIIHRHGGRVWAEGTVGKGATFYFSLPAK